MSICGATGLLDSGITRLGLLKDASTTTHEPSNIGEVAFRPRALRADLGLRPSIM